MLKTNRNHLKCQYKKFNTRKFRVFRVNTQHNTRHFRVFGLHVRVLNTRTRRNTRLFPGTNVWLRLMVSVKYGKLLSVKI